MILKRMRYWTISWLCLLLAFRLAGQEGHRMPGYYIQALQWENSEEEEAGLEQLLISKPKTDQDFALELHMKSFRMDAKGRLQIWVQWKLNRDSIIGPIPLFEFKTQFQTKNALAFKKEMQGLVAKSLKEHLQQWWKKHWDSDPRLAQEIKVRIEEDYLGSMDEADTLFYAAQNLDWDDFMGEAPKQSTYAAQIFSSFEFSTKPEVYGATIHLPITLKVYMLRKSSWRKDIPLPSSALAHEQTHFNITAWAADKFKLAITDPQKPLRPLWYDSELQWRFLDAFRWMNQTQKNYDEESRHGMDAFSQSQWDQRYPLLKK